MHCLIDKIIKCKAKDVGENPASFFVGLFIYFTADQKILIFKNDGKLAPAHRKF